jgi:hypothetical protein
MAWLGSGALQPPQYHHANKDEVGDSAHGTRHALLFQLTRMFRLMKMAGSSFIIFSHAGPLGLRYTIHSIPLKC